MKQFVTITFLCFAQLLFAQKVKHHGYITYYNNIKGGPDSVSWLLTPSMVNCETATRKDKFVQDPKITNCTSPKEYKKSGYDKGHMFPYADAECNSTDQVECFYMSNMLPQLHAFNAGDWKTLEEQERVWATDDTIKIIAGGYGIKGKLKSGVNIPESCWKAIYYKGHWRAWIMPNEKTSKGHAYGKWEVLNIKRFDKIVGLGL